MASTDSFAISNSIEECINYLPPETKLSLNIEAYIDTSKEGSNLTGNLEIDDETNDTNLENKRNFEPFIECIKLLIKSTDK